MSSALHRSLAALVARAGASAAVVIKRIAQPPARFVLAAEPPELLIEGTPWPDTELPDGDSVELLQTHSQLTHLVPVRLRLALPQPPTAALVHPWREGTLELLLVWCQPGVPSVSAAELHGLMETELADQASAWDCQRQAELEALRLTAVVSHLEQAVISIDDRRGVAHLNARAARLLDLPVGDSPVTELSAAMTTLEQRALNPEVINALGATVLSHPDRRPPPVIWRFDTEPTHLKVSTAAICQDGFSGRVWVLDDVSAQLAALEQAERAHRAQVESDLRFRLSMQNAAVGMSLNGIDGSFLDLNDALCRILGRSRDVLQGMSWLELVHPDDRSMGQDRRQELMEGRQDNYRLSKRFLRPDGQVVWGDLSVSCVRDEHGEVQYFISQIIDITGQMQAQQALAQQEERYRLLTENSSDVVVHLRDNRVAWVSSSVAVSLGAPPAYWIGRHVKDLLDPEDLGVYTEAVLTLDLDRSMVRRVRLRAADGAPHWIEAHAKTYLNQQGQPDGVTASFRIVDEEVRAQSELDYRARYDQLTGLLNRSEIFARYGALMANPDQRAGHTAALFCDVDSFKTINDTYGHAAGDDVLKGLSQRIRTCLRNQDLPARLGGDEFLVLLTGIRRQHDALLVADKIHGLGSAPVMSQGRQIATSLSIGVTLAKPQETLDALIARADTAMYTAKQSGRNRVIAIEAEPS